MLSIKSYQHLASFEAQSLCATILLMQSDSHQGRYKMLIRSLAMFNCNFKQNESSKAVTHDFSKPVILTYGEAWTNNPKYLASLASGKIASQISDLVSQSVTCVQDSSY